MQILKATLKTIAKTLKPQRSFALSPYLDKVKPKSFSLNGDNFTAQKVFVSKGLFRKLGINPRYFRSFLKIYLLDKENYARFCRVSGISPKTEGFYPLARNGQLEDVLLGKKSSLRVPDRVIVFPEGSENKRALAHEILHDIFLGGGLAAETRAAFTKHLFIWAHKALTDPSRAAEARFYTEIAKRCTEKLNINLPGKDVVKIFEGAKLDRSSRLFVGECFAYAGEIFLGYTQEAELGKLPREIRYFFESEKAIQLRFR
jgi:hypothetical protein